MARTQVENHNHISLRSSKFGFAREDGKGRRKISKKKKNEQQNENRKLFMDFLMNAIKHVRGINSDLIQTPSEKKEENTICLGQPEAFMKTLQGHYKKKKKKL